MTIPADITAVKQYIPAAEFRKVLKDVPSGIFSMDAWVRWHERLGISPVPPPAPRRRFPDGTLGPEPGSFFGR